jgi:hypothetical protein
VPFFQGMPVAFTHWSAPDDWANAPDTEAASAADAKSDATWFSFFMVLLSRDSAVFAAKGLNWYRIIMLVNPRIAGFYHRRRIVP